MYFYAENDYSRKSAVHEAILCLMLQTILKDLIIEVRSAQVLFCNTRIYSNFN